LALGWRGGGPAPSVLSASRQAVRAFGESAAC